MKGSIPLGFDTETALIRVGLLSPPLTCITYAMHAPTKRPGWLNWVGERDTLPALRAQLEAPEHLLIGHNAPYDLAVIGAEWPELLPLIFSTLNDDRITDTGLRQKLIDIAHGQFRGMRDALTGQYTEHHYSLSDIHERHFGVPLEKDEHRLHYGELRDVHPDDWKPGAVAYAINDAEATVAIWGAQQEWAQFLKDEFRQARAAFGLHLISCWGIRTNAAAIKSFEIETEDAYNRALSMCQEMGLVRKDGSRDTKRARRHMLDTCEGLDINAKITKGFVKLRRKRDSGEDLTKRDNKNLVDPLFGISLDEEACLETADELLKSYSEVSSLMTVVRTHIPALWNGTTGPIQPRFEPLVETGRTACKGHSDEQPTNGYQMHNVRRLPGIRECFQPRPGKLFVAADYDGLELRTVSQVCIWAVGHSRLAEKLNEGTDVHIDLASQLLNLNYDAMTALHKEGGKVATDARQFSKIGNFGFWGGMQAKSFRAYARQPSNGGIKRTLKECEDLHEAWHSNWPESRDYFLWIQAQCGQANAATIEHFLSERYRGLLSFTVASNSFFQGLGSDATKAALFNIQRECFVDMGTALYGCRMVNYVHDEFMLEVDDDLTIANAAAERLVTVMCESAAPWLPDVPPRATPVLMRAWSKNAKPVYNDAGLLIPWEQAA